MTSILGGQNALPHPRPATSGNDSTTPARPELLRAQAALEHLKSDPTPAVDLMADYNATQKAFARERAAQIKEQLRQLAGVSAISPKAAARLFGQLTRQLTQAVDDYAKAGPDPRPQTREAPSAENPYPVDRRPHDMADREFFSFTSDLASRLDVFLDSALARAKAEDGARDRMLTSVRHGAEDDRRILRRGLNEIAGWHMPEVAPLIIATGPVNVLV